MIRHGLHLTRKDAAVLGCGFVRLSRRAQVPTLFKLDAQAELTERTQRSTNTHPKKCSTIIPGNELKYVCLNTMSIVNKYSDLDIMVADIDPQIIRITESWTNKDIIDAELTLTSYVKKDRRKRRGGGVILYIKESIQE